MIIAQDRKEKTVSEKINEWTRKYGCERDALNVATAKLEAVSVLLENAESNCNRFLNHLDVIATEIGIEWGDGEFPIKEALEFIHTK